MTYDREKFFVDKVLRLEEVILKHKQEMDAMWLHIRNLEQHLLNPMEVPVLGKPEGLDPKTYYPKEFLDNLK